MAEKLTRERVWLTIKSWKGHGDEIWPQTVDLLAKLDEAQKRSRETVDVGAAQRRLRSRVGPDLSAQEAERELEDIERSAVLARTAARLADFEAAGLEHAVVPVFEIETAAALPLLCERFDKALGEFKSVIVAIPTKVTDVKQAANLGGAVAHAWHQAASAEAAIEWCWQILDDLRRVGALPTIPRASIEDWRWSEPRRLPQARTASGRVHRVAHMRNALAAGVEPQLVTFENLRSRIAREAGEVAAAKAAARRDAGGTSATIGDPDSAVRDAIARVRDRHPDFEGVA